MNESPQDLPLEDALVSSQMIPAILNGDSGWLSRTNLKSHKMLKFVNDMCLKYGQAGYFKYACREGKI